MDQLRTGIVEGAIDSIPGEVREAVLDRIPLSGCVPKSSRRF
jgi:hypothetical protein